MWRWTRSLYTVFRIIRLKEYTTYYFILEICLVLHNNEKIYDFHYLLACFCVCNLYVRFLNIVLHAGRVSGMHLHLLNVIKKKARIGLKCSISLFYHYLTMTVKKILGAQPLFYAHLFVL